MANYYPGESPTNITHKVIRAGCKDKHHTQVVKMGFDKKIDLTAEWSFFCHFYSMSTSTLQLWGAVSYSNVPQRSSMPLIEQS